MREGKIFDSCTVFHFLSLSFISNSLPKHTNECTHTDGHLHQWHTPQPVIKSSNLSMLTSKCSRERVHFHKADKLTVLVNDHSPSVQKYNI